MSTVANAMAAQGYVPAKQRAGCGNCAHVEEVPRFTYPDWRCRLGDFRTSVLAICDRHQPRQPWMDE